MDAKLFDKAEEIKKEIKAINCFIEFLKEIKEDKNYLPRDLRDINNYNITKRLESKISREITFILLELDSKKLELEKQFKNL